MAQLGELRIDVNGTTKYRTIHDISDVNYPAFRVGVNGTPGSVYAVDPESASDSSVRVTLPDGTKALVDTISTIYETFDDGAWPDGWDGGSSETNAYQLVDTYNNSPFTHDASSGGYSLQSTSSWGYVGNSNYTTRRGNEYVVRVAATSHPDEFGPALNIADQYVNSSADPGETCYRATLDYEDNGVALRRQENGNQTYMQDVLTDVDITTDEEYLLGVRFESAGVAAVLYDADGNTLAVGDSTHDGQETMYDGGVISVNAGDPDVYFDNIAETAIGNGPSTLDYSTV